MNLFGWRGNALRSIIDTAAEGERLPDSQTARQPDKTSTYHLGGCQCTVPPNI
jgi:hypothetical protein